MKRLLYFAYGSNMLLKRIFVRLGKIKRVGTYTLKGWQLVFNVGQHHMNSFANIVEKEGAEVEGVLYELRDDQIRQLDMCEAFYDKKYFVRGDDIVFVYVGDAIHSFSTEKPSLDYINIMLDGLEENNLIKTYNSLVDYKTNNFKLKGGCRHKKR